jgi:hypothetical protein
LARRKLQTESRSGARWRLLKGSRPSPWRAGLGLQLCPFGTWQHLSRRDLLAQHSHSSAKYISPLLNPVEPSRIAAHLRHSMGSNLDQECRLVTPGAFRQAPPNFSESVLSSPDDSVLLTFLPLPAHLDNRSRGFNYQTEKR